MADWAWQKIFFPSKIWIVICQEDLFDRATSHVKQTTVEPCICVAERHHMRSAEPLGAHSNSTTCRPITRKTHFYPKQRTQCIITSCHVYNPTLKYYKGSRTLSLCIGHRPPCTFSSSCPSSTTLLLDLYISIRGSHQTSIITLIDPSIPFISSLTN